MAVALCGSFLFPATVGAEHVWEVILNPRALTADSVGCSNSHSDVAKHCSNAGHHSKILGQNPITIGGTTYTITEMRLTGTTLTIEFDPAPPAAIDGWLLNAAGYVKTLRRQSGGIVTASATGLNWPEGSTVKIRLDDPRLPHDPDSELLKPASRSGRCGPPEDGLSPDSDEEGYWHCHGDSIYHRHAGTWRGSHAPREEPPPPPPPPSQAERNKGWHWHGDELFHTHNWTH